MKKLDSRVIVIAILYKRPNYRRVRRKVRDFITEYLKIMRQAELPKVTRGNIPEGSLAFSFLETFKGGASYGLSKTLYYPNTRSRFISVVTPDCETA